MACTCVLEQGIHWKELIHRLDQIHISNIVCGHMHLSHSAVIWKGETIFIVNITNCMICSSSSVVFLTENVFKERFLSPAIDTCVIQMALWALPPIITGFTSSTRTEIVLL